jgi:hypothetical protein
MTARRHFKQLVRARMSKTGESYTTARREVLRQAPSLPTQVSHPWHFPGQVGAAAALRSLVTAAGLSNPATGRPFSEAMLFGIAGGIGAGVFEFHYAKENFSSFFIAGRHLWQDNLAWARAALARLGLSATVKEATARKAAETQLEALLADGRPVMAWVDSASLPYRAMPAAWAGGGYHVITVYDLDRAAGTATVGDLTDEPIVLPLTELAAARARIKSFKHRLLAAGRGKRSPPLRDLVRGGVAACVDGLRKAKQKNFRLDAFREWADRLDGRGPDSWEASFPPGHRLYQGLWSITEFIEHSGTGGGLCRPLFAEFLAESAAALGDRGLERLAARYAGLGESWSALAAAALPEPVPELAQVRELLARKHELYASGGAGARKGLAACWAELEARAARCRQHFPLRADEAAALRGELAGRVRALHEGEREALDALAGWAGS